MEGSRASLGDCDTEPVFGVTDSGRAVRRQATPDSARHVADATVAGTGPCVHGTDRCGGVPAGEPFHAQSHTQEKGQHILQGQDLAKSFWH